MKRPRVLPLGDKLKPDDFLRVLSIMEFPNDTFAAKVYAQVIKRKIEGSSVSSFLMSQVEQNRYQKQISGERVRIAAEALAHGFEISGRKVTYLAAEFSAQTDEAHKSGLPYSESAIRAGFEKFRDVAHLWAAANSMAGHVEQITEVGGLTIFLSRADAFFDALKPIAGSGFNPWVVPDQFRLEEPLALRKWNSSWVEIAKAYTVRSGN